MMPVSIPYPQTVFVLSTAMLCCSINNNVVLFQGEILARSTTLEGSPVELRSRLKKTERVHGEWTRSQQRALTADKFLLQSRAADDPRGNARSGSVRICLGQSRRCINCTANQILQSCNIDATRPLV
jgi:hypothetical protein